MQEEKRYVEQDGSDGGEDRALGQRVRVEREDVDVRQVEGHLGGPGAAERIAPVAAVELHDDAALGCGVGGSQLGGRDPAAGH